MTMGYKEVYNGLSSEHKEIFESVLKSLLIGDEDREDLFKLKIKLEGANFHASVPADYAHALWRLQQSYYKLVAQVLYGNPNAVLTNQDKQDYLLVFSIKQGSTESVVSLFGGCLQLAEKAIDKMNSVQILLFCLIIAGAFIGSKWFNYLNNEKKMKLEKERQEHTEKIRCEELESLLSANKAIVETAMSAGKEGRISILRGVSGLEKAKIGDKEYTENEISDIKRRNPRVKAKSETRILKVSIEKIDLQDKENLRLTLIDESGKRIALADTSSLRSNGEEYYTEAMDLIWESARCQDRPLWVEVSMAHRRDKLVECSILAVARDKEDLPDDSDDDVDE